jgi:hypothetical protein
MNLEKLGRPSETCYLRFANRPVNPENFGVARAVLSALDQGRDSAGDNGRYSTKIDNSVSNSVSSRPK